MINVINVQKDIIVLEIVILRIVYSVLILYVENVIQIIIALGVNRILEKEVIVWQ